MTFTNPRTWANDDYVSSATFNTHVRDNLRWLLGHHLNPMPFARVRSEAPVSLATSQWTTLRYDEVVVDRGGMFASGAGSALIAPVAGRYRIGAAVDIENVACNKALRLIVNASRVLAERDRPGVGSPVPGRITISTAAELAAGDFIEAEAWHDLGVPINAVPGPWAPVLWAHWEGTDL